MTQREAARPATLALFGRKSLYEARRQAVFREAGRQFAAKGFNGTSIEDIAKNLNLTKTGIYHYAKSKEELLFQCYLTAIDYAEVSLDSAEAENTTGLRALSQYIAHQIRTLDPAEGQFAVLSEYFSLTPNHETEIRAKARNIDHRIQALIQSGMNDGSISATDPRIAAFVVAGAINWIPKWFRADGERTIEDIAEIFSDMLTKGLGISGSGADE